MLGKVEHLPRDLIQLAHDGGFSQFKLDEARIDLKGGQNGANLDGEVSAHELQRGNRSERDSNRGQALTLPFGDLAADFFENPIADGHNQAAFFGDGNEAAGGIMPSTGWCNRSSACSPQKEPSIVNLGW